MRFLVTICRKLSIWMNIVAGTVIFSAMFLTITDVFLRLFRKPINGTYELVAVAGAITIGFALPRTSWDGGHIVLDLPIIRSKKLKHVLFIVTRLLGFLVFALLGWNLFLKGYKIYMVEEVSQILHIPGYPFAYAMGFCCWIECLVLLTDIFRSRLMEIGNE